MAWQNAKSSNANRPVDFRDLKLSLNEQETLDLLADFWMAVFVGFDDDPKVFVTIGRTKDGNRMAVKVRDDRQNTYFETYFTDGEGFRKMLRDISE